MRKLPTVITLTTHTDPNKAHGYTSQAFPPPQLFDLKAMLQKAQIRLELVRDEVELMQTAPDHMHRVIRDLKAGVVFDDTASGTQLDARYEQVAMTLILYDIRSRLATWRIVVRECKNGVEAFERYKDQVQPATPLPREVDLPLCSIAGMLESCRRKLGELFDRLLPTMRPVKDRFKYVQNGERISVQERQSMVSDDPVDRMYWILYWLRKAIDSNNFGGATRWFDMLERQMLVSSPAGLVDKRVYDPLSALAAIDEIRSIWLWSQLYNTELPM